MTPTPQSAVCIITDASRSRVLLIKREDFRIWALPAGGVEAGESCEEAAMREAREETGFHVELTALVAEYTRPQFADRVCVYAARVVGGSADEHGWEAVDVQWFPLDALPKGMPWVHHRYLDDWRASDFPVRRVLRMPWRFVLMVRVMTSLRDIRNRMMGLP